MAGRQLKCQNQVFTYKELKCLFIEYADTEVILLKYKAKQWL